MCARAPQIGPRCQGIVGVGKGGCSGQAGWVPSLTEQVTCCNRQQQQTEHKLLRSPHERLPPTTTLCLCSARIRFSLGLVFTTPTPAASPRAGYPFDVLPPGSRLPAHLAAVYHLPLLIAFSVRPDTAFVWGGCMALRRRALVPGDPTGLLRVRCGGGLRVGKGVGVVGIRLGLGWSWTEQRQGGAVWNGNCRMLSARQGVPLPLWGLRHAHKQGGRDLGTQGMWNGGPGNMECFAAPRDFLTHLAFSSPYIYLLHTSHHTCSHT